MERLSTILRHLVSPVGVNTALQAQPTASAMSGATPSDDDVVICSALRTPIGKAVRGSFKNTPCEELLTPLFKATLEKTKLDANLIEDVAIGNVSQPGAGATTARAAQFLACLPMEVPISTVNRQCCSGLQAAVNIASNIIAGNIDVGIAGGVENMSMYGIMDGVDFNKLSTEIPDNELAAGCLTPMGITSENVAEKYGITREKQDAVAARSHQKALAAQKMGLFAEEIVPVTVEVKQSDGSIKEVVVTKDEGPREGTTAEGLSALKPAFRVGGTTTAGNSSQTSDGASMVLLARRSKAKSLGLPILARFRSFAAVGVDPRFMGIGPAMAIPVALKKAGLHVDDIDIFEINEAFASQATMSVEHLKIPMEKVNPKGGAIALGHPLGCTGTRQIATLLPEMKRQRKRLGVVSMCIGTGMGAAAVIENEQ
eukprot:TRINITY_DN69757_c0_g1_i1.p1 TRINITY_DN69757_c0_g1~~TRINITY_DN69757_c0_g1_i1.p1  ORF type:complete len:428 (-),score=83.44 TRINITY_DN69757_c0_g1_i1:494-1777(-)